MTTLSSLSARMSSSASMKARQSGRFQQLRLSGRLRMMRATPAPLSRSRMSSGHSLSLTQVFAPVSAPVSGIASDIRFLRLLRLDAFGIGGIGAVEREVNPAPADADRAPGS